MRTWGRWYGARSSGPWQRMTPAAAGARDSGRGLSGYIPFGGAMLREIGCFPAQTGAARFLPGAGTGERCRSIATCGLFGEARLFTRTDGVFGYVRLLHVGMIV